MILCLHVTWKYLLLLDVQVSTRYLVIPEVIFVTAVTASGSEIFFASGVNFSIFTHFFVFLSPKLLKLAEIDGVKVLA